MYAKIEGIYVSRRKVSVVHVLRCIQRICNEGTEMGS